MSSRSLRPRSRKIAASALAATLGLAGLGLASPPAGATADFDLERYAGITRIETAVAISEATFGTAADGAGSTEALISRDDLYPDALAGNYLAGVQTAPILLSGNSDVPQATLDELADLGVTDVTLLGGTNALDASVQAELEAAGYTVNRVAGVDRYETAEAIATQPGAPVGTTAAGNTAILATGENFPDALAAGALSYSEQFPLLLTPSDMLGEDASAAFTQLAIDHVLIAGGTDAVSASVEADLTAMGITSQRLAGATRYETAVEIAEYAVSELGYRVDHAEVATGRDFPDALTGGPHAGTALAPILLADDVNSAAACAYLTSIANTVEGGAIFGGTAAVSLAVEQALEACGRDVTTTATFDAQSVEAGQPLTGTLTGDFASAEIAGDCIEGGTATVTPADDTDATADDVQFSVDISQTAASGDCVITVTFSDADGNEIGSDTATVTITQPVGVTTRPELVAAAIGNTVTDSQVTPTNPAGTRVSYTFDENIDLFPAVGSEFHVYNADGTRADTANGVVVSRTDNTVVVNFPNLNTAALAAPLTLATVDFGAVTDDQGQDNPEGDAAIGTAVAPGTTGSAGITAAPDLLSVGNFRAAATPGETAVDFTFDEAAFVTGLAGFDLIQINGVELDCTGPTTANPSGGTTAGGDGTTTITVSCLNADPATTLTAAGIARGTVLTGTVSDAGGTNPNVLQAAEVSNNGNSSDPDLVSAEFRPGTGTAVDQVLFVFDEAVATATAADFNVYNTSAVETPGQGTALINTANRTQVLVDFPNGTLATAVGANVEDLAVTATDNAAPNEQDEVGVENTQATAGRTPGETAAPELRGVTLGTTTDGFGNVTGASATYTFDEDITAAVAGRLFLYLADGTQLTCSDAALVVASGNPPGSNNTVTCDTYGTASSATISSAVLGTVDDAAVTPADGGPTNPEGAEFTTGGTGTPQQ